MSEKTVKEIREYAVKLGEFASSIGGVDVINLGNGEDDNILSKDESIAFAQGFAFAAASISAFIIFDETKDNEPDCKEDFISALSYYITTKLRDRRRQEKEK